MNASSRLSLLIACTALILGSSGARDDPATGRISVALLDYYDDCVRAPAMTTSVVSLGACFPLGNRSRTVTPAAGPRPGRYTLSTWPMGVSGCPNSVRPATASGGIGSCLVLDEERKQVRLAKAPAVENKFLVLDYPEKNRCFKGQETGIPRMVKEGQCFRLFGVWHSLAEDKASGITMGSFRDAKCAGKPYQSRRIVIDSCNEAVKLNSQSFGLWVTHATDPVMPPPAQQESSLSEESSSEEESSSDEDPQVNDVAEIKAYRDYRTCQANGRQDFTFRIRTDTCFKMSTNFATVRRSRVNPNAGILVVFGQGMQASCNSRDARQTLGFTRTSGCFLDPETRNVYRITFDSWMQPEESSSEESDDDDDESSSGQEEHQINDVAVIKEYGDVLTCLGNGKQDASFMLKTDTCSRIGPTFARVRRTREQPNVGTLSFYGQNTREMCSPRSLRQTLRFYRYAGPACAYNPDSKRYYRVMFDGWTQQPVESSSDEESSDEEESSSSDLTPRYSVKIWANKKCSNPTTYSWDAVPVDCRRWSVGAYSGAVRVQPNLKKTGGADMLLWLGNPTCLGPPDVVKFIPFKTCLTDIVGPMSARIERH